MRPALGLFHYIYLVVCNNRHLADVTMPVGQQFATLKIRSATPESQEIHCDAVCGRARNCQCSD